ncbi:tetratricopeptide repeat protein [Bradyrhizobium jicamae]|uniref:tetratricopeptide repeat protein n=1 Tax=Bradyrhizobium jicamae TaxID=280332 RepID=UPI001BA91B6E|nr:tetratricopeptide repeat protein [Bradyrhizobium jicamae]
MFQKSSRQISRVSRLAGAASAAILLIGLSACQTSGPSDIADITGSLGDKADQTQASADPRRDLETYRERVHANPKDVDAALQYAKALRATGQRAQAAAMLEQAVLAQPNNKALLAGYGRALADNGNFQQAFDVLGRAHTPEDPDWRILSAQGAVLDQLDRHDEARQYYDSALKIRPDDPSVLSNLGLSYLLSKDLPKAEETLRHARDLAPADMRVRTNLAVVVSLEGRQSEAETIMKANLPPEEGAANVAALKRLLSRREASRSDTDKIPVAGGRRND